MTRKMITAKDKYVQRLLSDPYYRVTRTGLILTRFKRRSRQIADVWRNAGWVSTSRRGTKNYVRVLYKGVYLYAHRIVWAAFNGPLRSDMTVNHRDLNGLNNHIENLELVTASENTVHAQTAYRRMGMSAAELRANWKRGNK